MKSFLSFTFGLPLIACTTLHGASYTKTNGSIVDPILDNLGAAHPYCGSNLDENLTRSFASLSNADLEDADLRFALLTNVDLSNADLGNADLRFAVLTNVNLTGVDLAGADLNSAELDGVNLAGADLSDVDLGSAILTGAQGQLAASTNLSVPAGYVLHNQYLVGPGAILTGADLSGIDVDGIDLSGADLTGATLTGVEGELAGSTNLTLPQGYGVVNDLIVGPGANLSQALLSGADLQGVDLSGADLTFALLNDTNLADVDFSGATMTFALLNNATLGGADLSTADLGSAGLTGVQGQLSAAAGVSLPAGYFVAGNHLVGPGVNLANANLAGVSLNGVNLDGVNLSGADLSGASVETVGLDGANLAGANLSGATFNNADLSNATVSGALLTNADLGNANAADANFVGADLSGADLGNVTLTSAVFTGARYNESTTFPGGADPLALGMILNSLDTDGDGVADFVELAFGGDPNDGTDAHLVATAVAEREEKFTEEQILDLRVGGVMLQRDGANFTLNYSIEESEDLLTWTPFAEQPGPFVFAPGDADKKFVHITIEE